MAAISTAVSQVIEWIGGVITALFGSDGAWADLLPFVLLSVGASIIFLGVKLVRKLCWAL